jgi:hypothetical protein
MADFVRGRLRFRTASRISTTGFPTGHCEKSTLASMLTVEVDPRVFWSLQEPTALNIPKPGRSCRSGPGKSCRDYIETEAVDGALCLPDDLRP